MVIPNCRRCFSSLILIILLLKSTRADDLQQSLNSTATAPLDNFLNRTTTIIVEAKPTNNYGNQRPNVNILSSTVAERNVQIKLSDLQQMVVEYLDDNLPSTGNDDTGTEQQNGVVPRGFSRNQLFVRLRKFAERYIHPDISKAVTSTGRVFLLKGKHSIYLMSYEFGTYSADAFLPVQDRIFCRVRIKHCFRNYCL